MGNGNNAPPSNTPMLLIGGLVLLLILLCCSSAFFAYSRNGNINIFSSTGALSADELAYAQAHGGAPQSSGGALGLMDAFGVAQKCKLSPWSEWSACDANCGSQSHRRRTRTVVTPAKNGGSCSDPLFEDDLCTNLPPCEVPALNGQYEPCPADSTLVGADCIAQGKHLSAGECDDLRNQAAGQGAKAGATYGVGLGVLIGAAVAAGEFDCATFYYCPVDFRDTHVEQKCDKPAIPKCPPGGYTYSFERGMCIMPAAAPSSH